MEKVLPEGMIPLEGKEFTFACHKDVPCFTRCCKQVEMTLYPYDVLRLKNSIKISSSVFLQKYTRLVQGHNPFFPTLMLQCTQEGGLCPFLSAEGCSVYEDRPSACRTYPLERGINRNPGPGEQAEFYFLTNHDYCHGHLEKRIQTVKSWVRGQRLERYNLMNDLYGELDTIFSTNPWKGEGHGGKLQQLAFMICYDIDAFAEYIKRFDLLSGFRLNRNAKRSISDNQEEMLKFGFEWLKLVLGRKSNLSQK